MMIDNKSVQKKLQKFKKLVKEFSKSKKSATEDIHILRTKSRELYSILDQEEEFRADLKKVIKLSNHIRDIDVFYAVFIAFLPKKYVKKLDMKTILASTTSQRKKELNQLHKYLQSISIPQNAESKTTKKGTSDAIDVNRLNFNQAELHKYRIYIKKKLFREKNSLGQDKNKIETLIQIKDLLGMINDYSNGLEMLKKYPLNASLIEDIESCTQKENLKLFKKFKKIIRSVL
jgi:CHAD domain-containing protein